MPYEKLDLSTLNPVLSWANNELDSRETQMAKNVASLPFVFKHVALMPDVHLGKGALVGSVIATKDAVIPAAVGVDIGCFTGDTLIPVADGNHYSLQELAETGKSVNVYSCTSSGKIVVTQAISRLTKRNASLIKIVLDNGSKIKCTPDHQFMLRDGDYQEASNLQVGTSLMPFYSQTDRDGYTLVQQNYSGRWQKIASSQLVEEKINNYQYDRGYNHKVVAVIPLTEKEDVYCLSVPEYHNFALSAGVFVHNCGMAAIKMPFQQDKLEGKLKKIRKDIEAAIPVGFNQNKNIEKAVTNWQGWSDFKELHPGVQRLDNKALKQMGSLGGGNHFIELCLDTDGQVWLMLHSGSRHIGNQLAQCHIDTGKELAKLADLKLPDLDLAYFVKGTAEFAAYWQDLQWAQDYARFNRDVMMGRFKAIVEKHLAGGKSIKPLLSVNCHHNYAEQEHHFGEDVYVTRKGAVRAKKDDYGIIPGSMGAKSFIVKGKGNHDSYCSCFVGETQVLTNKGLMSIKDVYNSAEAIELVSYNEQVRKFEFKPIVESSVREVEVNSYSISQTIRREDNTLIGTKDHPMATYEKGQLTYQAIEKIAENQRGVIVPTQVNLTSDFPIESQDANFYYLLGIILSDGTIHYQSRKNSPEIHNRPRGGKDIQGYIRIYQSATQAKQLFIEYLEKLFKIYTSQVACRTSPGKVCEIKGRNIQGKELTEITISDLNFVEKVINILPQLPKILMTNPYLALHFLAGYLDGDGSHNKRIISISVGKEKIFSYFACTLLSLGTAYKVYRNRDNYVIEFRDNILMNKLSELCQRLEIAKPSERLYEDKLLLASSLVGGNLFCRDLPSYAKQNKMVAVTKFQGQDIDSTLAMNRIFKVDCAGKQPVYNFTIQDNHNYIVFSKYYTPVLVHNCSHGAGRLMSRSKAKKLFTVDDVVKQTEGIECRKDNGVIDEIPAAYKPIEEVMQQQTDLVEIVATLKQVICIKG
jgi:tRNA-splicing ligase RtcB (3'-phosphate/5'-hydroxy nucleic acid ligase)